ncbi:MAG: hypothetical protein GF421_04625 [Candidatus Aminicenantes bacterium]|nr:hypothetical protein [Candidatus Aminicenantes bacterium]
MNLSDRERRDLIAQWAFDTRSILGRMHLWLENVEMEWFRGKQPTELHHIGFMDGRMERLMTMTAAVTALGTQLFGRYGEGKGKSKKELNRVKKDGDAISAYAMSESLWYATRQLPENHAVLVCMGEGLMPKVGETKEMGSNPQLGFGRVYARPQVAKWLDSCVARLLNEEKYGWDEFRQDIKISGVTVWGAAIDTLENTSRFAKGKPTGPLTVLHLFNQPLHITKPYEAYMGNLFLPVEVVRKAEEHSVLLDFMTPRKKVVEALEATYPGIQRKHIHVWTLGGESRTKRLGWLWKQWEDLGVHLVEDGWTLPTKGKAFSDSGTYAPTYLVGTWKDKDNETHIFLLDGYAASAEAMQAVSLTPALDLDGTLVTFTSKFELSIEKEQHVMQLDPDHPEFKQNLEKLFQKSVDQETADTYRDMIMEAREAEMPSNPRVIRADDFFPEKKWEVMAFSGYMCDDPYTGASGVERINEKSYKVTTRISTPRAGKRITFTLRLMEEPEEQRLVFNPLLIRFIYGEDFRARPVKISDSGRIRNELQTLCSEALEYQGGGKIRVHFDKIPPEVISLKDQKVLREVLHWYKKHHPLWFRWLEIPS